MRLYIYTYTLCLCHVLFSCLDISCSLWVRPGPQRSPRDAGMSCCLPCHLCLVSRLWLWMRRPSDYTTRKKVGVMPMKKLQKMTKPLFLLVNFAFIIHYVRPQQVLQVIIYILHLCCIVYLLLFIFRFFVLRGG